MIVQITLIFSHLVTFAIFRQVEIKLEISMFKLFLKELKLRLKAVKIRQIRLTQNLEQI